MEAILATTAFALTAIGLYGLLTCRHMIRLVLCFNILEAAVLLAIVLLAYRPEALAPLVRDGEHAYVFPLPHALAVTAIVIGASLTALMLAFVVRIYKSRGSVNIDELKEWRR